MSKTVDIQIEKSRNLLNGLKKHIRETGDKRLSENELASTESALDDLARISSEIEKLREQLNPMVKEMNNMLTSVKLAYGEQKKIIKGRYPMERWPEYGVSDKR